MRTILLCIMVILSGISPAKAQSSKGTAYIQGTIEGYNPQTDAESSIINVGNNLTGEDCPVMIHINPDGRFETKLELNYPIESYFLINGTLNIPFYIEPGQTLSIYINWKAIQRDRRAIESNSPVIGIQYTGPSATISQMYRQLRELIIYPTEQIGKAQRELPPNQFPNIMRPIFTQWDQIGDSLAQVYSSSEKALHLIRNKIALEKGRVFANFLLQRAAYAMRDTTNQFLKMKADDSIYDFLKAMPLNDELLISDASCREFMNRFEFMLPLWDILEKRYGNPLSGLKNAAKMTDKLLSEQAQKLSSEGGTIVDQLSGQPNSFFWQATLLRHLVRDLKMYKSRKVAELQVEALCKRLTHPILIAEARNMLEVIRPEKLVSYQLPESKGADIFRNIIKAHAGKVLFVDFWSTTCGGCRKGIQNTAELRKKYKNHPQFQFIYITDEKASREKDYNSYVAKNLEGEASYRIPQTEFNYLCELFKFNALPHYELIQKDGSVMINSPTADELAEYLKKHFDK